MASVLPFVRGVDFSRVEFQDGHFEDKVRELSNLRWLRLNRSQFNELPGGMDCFPKLEVLTVARNQLAELHNGSIANIQSLRILNASHNSIPDSGMPSDLFKIRDLVTLDLSHNHLSRVPEDMAKAQNMIVLSLSYNKLTSIQGSLFVHCSDIQYLDLSHNQLQSLPPQLRRLEQLRTLNLANNPLQHYTFKNLDKLWNLTSLNLSNTSRDFSNTPHLDKLIYLTDLDMSCNNLSRIPEPVYLLEKLHRVNMSHNSIKELSSLIDTWEQLVTLDLSFNQLTALHPNICKCVKLKRLFLNNNRLSFEGIPPGIGKLADLQHFLAARNNLECIPEGICRLYSLRKLVLTSNCLVTLPEGIHFLKLEKLDIGDNPNLIMPLKPKEKVKGSGAEWYNIDFDPEILKKGAVVNTASVIKGAYTRQKERRLKVLKTRKSSTTGQDEVAAQKVLKGLADVAGQRDVLLAGAAVEMVPQEDNSSGSPTRRPKRWDLILQRPDLDYSDIFSEDTGTLPGLTIWQIENFSPVEVEETFHGNFYIGDCYIILKSYWNDSSELDWVIHFWIGNDSSLDKCACAAMHAIHLRNMLGATGRTQRQEQGDEDEEFLDMFPEEISYIEGGTASGFFTMEEDDIPIRLFRLCGVKRPFLYPVETESTSLDRTGVFILDAGTEIFIWYDTKSSLMSRSKARLIAEKINKHERKNKSILIETRAGIEPDDFWALLGGPPEESIPTSSLTAYKIPQPILYKAGLGQGYLELPQVDLPQGQLHQSLLRSTEVYILDCHTDIFVWIGRKSSRLVRAAALKLAQELLEMVKRPLTVAMVTRCQEGMEHQIFQCRFAAWNEVLAVDYTQTPEMLERKIIQMKNPLEVEKKALKVDLSPLFLPRELYMPNRTANELTMKWNTQLLTMRCCVIEGKKFSILSNREKGHFYTAECYFFLCRYRIANEEKVSLDEDGDDDDDENDEEDEEIETVVYFWQGRQANNMGWLHFTHGIQKQLEHAMDGPIDVIRFKQQQENMKFLSHFGGKFIIHRGHRNSESFNSSPALYQIRASSSKICRRVVQTTARPISLNSCFCHILKVPFEGSEGSGIVYIWIGSQTTQEEAIHAEQMGRSMFESTYSNVVIREGSEPENFFWVAMGGKSEYEESADFMKLSRLFRCSNEKGFFVVSEKCSDFCQEDLSEDDVMIMDNGTIVFIWFGKNSSEMEKKLAMKSAQVYITHITEEGGKRKFKFAKHGSESWDFKKCFHGWIDQN